MARRKVTPEKARQHLREALEYNERRKLEEEIEELTQECRRACEQSAKEMEKFWAHPPRIGDTTG